MNYAFMSFSTPELSLDEVLATAGRLGYDGVELRLDSDHKHGVEVGTDQAGRDAARQKAARSGVVLCCIATSCQLANMETAEEQVADMLERINLASDVGSTRIRVFGGQFPEEVSREEATDTMVEALAAAADHAAECGVAICVETHDAWCDPEHLAEVMRRVDHPAVAVNWDIMHPVRTGKATMDEAFQTLRPWIRHLHVHDGTADGLVPIGEGDVDHRRAIELLLEMGYDGYISGEWINWEPWETHLPRELAALKQYEAELQG